MIKEPDADSLGNFAWRAIVEIDDISGHTEASHDSVYVSSVCYCETYTQYRLSSISVSCPHSSFRFGAAFPQISSPWRFLSPRLSTSLEISASM